MKSWIWWITPYPALVKVGIQHRLLFHGFMVAIILVKLSNCEFLIWNGYDVNGVLDTSTTIQPERVCGDRSIPLPFSESIFGT